MKEPLTIVLWLWQGWRPVYDQSHVEAMAAMLAEYLTIPFRLVCITDQDIKTDVCEVYPLWPLEHKFRIERGRPNSYVRLKLFSEWAATEFPGQVWSIDLDAVIFENIDSLYTTADFKINRGRAAPYNGAMWILRTGTHTEVWDKLSLRSPMITKAKGFTGSDQAWLSHCLPNKPTWDEADGVFHYSTLMLNERTERSTKQKATSARRLGIGHSNWSMVRKEPFVLKKPETAKMLFFAGSIKPWNPQLKTTMSGVFAHYQKFLP